LQHFEHDDPTEEDIDLPTTSAASPPRVLVPKKPAHVNQTITSIEKNHHCPTFSSQFKIYLNSLLDKRDTLPRSNIPVAFLPFDKVNVWHSFKFGRDILGNDIEVNNEDKDWVRAKPTTQKGVGRFDTVLVAHTHEAESTGMKGEFIFFNLQSSVIQAEASFTLSGRNKSWKTESHIYSP
jgi:hypothetical protein